MTYHLAALRLRSIGERSARFTDLTLDTTAPVDGQLAPSDSLVWLRNGGGKSSLLSLFYALLLPHANDFMGRAVKRSLTDYVDTGDTAHTIAVWHSVDRETLDGTPARVLITGAIYEWQDLRRPPDPDKDRERLNWSYYACYAVPGVIDAATLPLTGPDGTPLRRSAVIARLRELAEQHPSAMDLALPRTQRDWTDELQRRGIDPELYRRQKEMNHVEGGVEDLFRFSSAREFIDFLLDLTVPPEEAGTVAESLGKIADLLATKPAKTEERDFCREAAIGLGRIASARAERDGHAAGLATAEADAAGLAASFAAARDAAQAARGNLDLQRTVIEEAMLRAQGQEREAHALAEGYRHRGTQLHLARATEALEVARGTAEEAEAVLRATRLTGRLAEQARLGALLAQVREEMKVERADAEPFRIARDVRASSLLDRLLRLSETDSARAEAAAERAAQERSVAEAHAKAAELAQQEVREAERGATVAETRLEELADQVRLAVAAGLLAGEDVDPQVAHEAAVERAHDLTVEREAVRAARSSRPARRTALHRRQQELGQDRTRTDGERAAVVREAEQLRVRAAALAALERVRDLAEATADAPVDVWAEGPVLVRRLVDRVRAADEALIRAEAVRLDDERVLDGQTRTGLLPTSLDAARVLALLDEHGVPAESGWAHLRSVLPEARAAQALAFPGSARLGCGVVVPTAEVARARSLLASLGTVTTALVGVWGAEAADAVVAGMELRPDENGPAWTALDPGLVDVASAESAATAIRARLSHQGEERAGTTRQRDADRALLARIEALLADAPEGHLAALDARVAALDEALEQSDAGLRGLAEELAELEAADEGDAVRERELSEAVTRESGVVLRLAALAERAAEAPTWRERLEQSRRWAATAQEQAARREQETQAALAVADASAAEAASARQRAEDQRAEAAGIAAPEQPVEPPAEDASLTLDTLRNLFRDAEATYRQRVSASVLAERELGLDRQLAPIRSELSRAPAALLERAEALLAGPDGQSEATREQAVQEADRKKYAADAAVVRAEVEVETVTAAERDLGRRVKPGTTLPVDPSDEIAAEELAVEQDAAFDRARDGVRRAERQAEGLRSENARLEQRAGLFAVLLEQMPEPAGEAEPFIGDDQAARASRRELTEALTVARDRQRDAEAVLTRAVASVRSVAGRYASVRTPARDRISGDAEDVLAATAATLADNLVLRADMIDGELEDIAKDQAIVTSSLAHLVGDTLDTLRKAERYSKLPASLGAWAGKQMMRISFETPAAEADLRAAIDRVIERRVAEGVKPQGLPLLKEAVHEAAGPRGFSVKVLKPTPDVSATSEDITRLGKWSGGEKLTVCVAIYCTLAALRARNTGRGETSGGVLVLDNPIGRASHGSLVRLQRDVAAAHGVQLIYTTGVKDPDAVSRFPNVLRLDNRPGRTRNRRYIVVDETAPAAAAAEDAAASTEAAPREVTGTRVAHEELEATDPEATSVAPEVAEVPGTHGS